MTFMPWLIAFVWTQIIEVPIYRWGFKIPLIEAGLASCLTHPFVWFVIPHLIPLSNYWTFFAVAEIFAIVAEALWFFWRGHKPALLASFVANATSASFGLLKWWVSSKIET
jgi:hypothetical protein